MKLTKAQIKAHKEAEALVDCGRPLHDEEKEFILDFLMRMGNGLTNLL